MIWYNNYRNIHLNNDKFQEWRFINIHNYIRPGYKWVILGCIYLTIYHLQWFSIFAHLDTPQNKVPEFE